MTRRWLALLAAALLAGCGTTERVRGWFGGDEPEEAPRAELVELANPTVQPRRLWSTEAGKGTDERFLRIRPALTGDSVYVADRDGRVWRLARDDGRKVWRVKTKTRISGGPGVGDGLVVVGTSDGEVLALAADDGQLRWRAKVTSEVLATPLVTEDSVYVRTGDGRLFALAAAGGDRRWLYDRGTPPLTLRGTSPPVLAGDLVLAGFANGKLVALEAATGRRVWELAISIPRGRSDLERMADLDAEPVVAGGTAYVATFQGRVAAVDLAAGAIAWSRDIPSHSGLAVAGSRLFVTGDDGSIWALDRASGASLWKQEALARRALSPPAVHAGRWLVVGDDEGYLHWLDLEDGRLAGRTRLDKSPVIARPLADGDLLIAYSSGGRLAAYVAD